jgi:peptide/nickel transport system substrate-binding protein
MPLTATLRLCVAVLSFCLPLAALAEGVLRVPYAADIGSFDPDNAFEVDGLGAINAVYEGLVEYAPGSAEIVGLLAEKWTTSEDGLLVTFDLRDGVIFHDGAAMTSADVLASFQRRKANELVLSYFLWNVQEMAAPDPDTFTITLGMPQPSFLDTLASPWGPKVVSPGALVGQAGNDAAQSFLNDNAIGTGPFALTRFERGTGYTLTRNAAYWGKAPHFETIEISIVPDVSQQLLQLRAGDLDMVPRNYPWAQLGALPPVLVATASPSMALVMGFVKPGTALEDPALRAAVMTAMNPAR